MVEVDDVRAMVSEAEHNPDLRKSLENLLNPDYWLDKYYDFDVAIESEYPGLVKLWGIDLHCYKLYSSKVSSAAPGKAVMFQALADAHRDSILNDLKEIEKYLNLEFEDFYGVMG